MPLASKASFMKSLMSLSSLDIIWALVSTR